MAALGPGGSVVLKEDGNLWNPKAFFATNPFDFGLRTVNLF